MQNDRIKTPVFTIVFPSIFTPRASAEGQEPKYSCIAVFPKSEDLTALKHLIKDAADARCKAWAKANLPEEYAEYEKYFVNDAPYNDDEIKALAEDDFSKLDSAAEALSIEDVKKRHA